MTTQQDTLIGYGGYTPEELHAIVRRAHRERARAMREFLTWVFARDKVRGDEHKQPARADAVACS